MFADTADPAFYARYVQPGVTRDLRSGLLKESKDLGGSLKDVIVSGAEAVKKDPELVVRELGKAIAGIPDALADAPGAIRDGFVESGQAIGEGAAVAFDDDLSNKLDAIYGTDVSGAQATLFGLRTVTAVAGAAGAAKAVSQIGKGGAKLIETVEGEIEARDAKKAKEQEIAERKERLNFEKDSIEVENRPAKATSNASDDSGAPVMRGSASLQNLELITSHPDAHSLGRHGGQVTDEQLMQRALTGISPDGHSKVVNEWRMESGLHNCTLPRQESNLQLCKPDSDNARGHSKSWRICLPIRNRSSSYLVEVG